MKIIYVAETYTKELGYIDNILPFEWGKQGDEVHIITCRLPVYYQIDENYFGKKKLSISNPIENNNQGVTIHTCKYWKIGSRILMKGLGTKIKSITPDVVVVRGLASPVLGQVVFFKLFNFFNLFTSTGQAYSAIPKALRSGRKLSWPVLRNYVTRFLPGRIFSFFSTACIGSTTDCIDCAIDFYGVLKHKVQVISLGVDTEIFYSVHDELTQKNRLFTRNKLGIPKDAILYIWTGRMTAHKGINLLAQAIEELNLEGISAYGLFVGAGPQADILKSYPHSIHHDFVKWKELGELYRAADVAVWPLSITTSTLDASACGLPIIMSDIEMATERWLDIGSTYESGNIESLKKELRVYLNSNVRLERGLAGSVRMKDLYSWSAIALKFRNLFVKHLTI
jgi:glycosyltransferase involved in cell wall biosynthesis